MKRLKNDSAGNIRRIELINFMCHRHLVVNFNDKLNFVVGSNGSGKSALLTAISLCLGCKASVTQRGNSVKSLIREGETQATISVTLTNEGPTAFRNEIYGNSIVIERTFNANLTASTSYKVKSELNKVISTKREEIIVICEHFNFQIDNPLVMLTQETSKRFLASSTPSDKYEFFLKGTQLDQLYTDYQYTMERLASMQHVASEAGKTVKQLQDDVQLLEQRVTSIENMQSAYEKRENLKGELVWSKALISKEAWLASQSAVTRTAGKIELFQVSRETLQAEKDKLLDTISQLNALIQERARMAKEEENKHSQLADKKRNVQSEQLEVQRTILRIQETIQEYHKEKELISNSANSQAHAYSLQQREVRINDLEQQITSMNAQITALRTEIAQEQTKKAELSQVLPNATEMLAKKLADLQIAKSKYQTLASSPHDSAVLYGEKIPLLLQEIKSKSRQFSHAPIGPIGLEISLKEPQWTQAVEVVLNKMLDAFIVTSIADRNLLQQLLDKYGLRNSIYTLSDASPLRHIEKISYPCVSDKIEIKSALVTKLLVKITKINRIVLVESRTKGYEVLEQAPRSIQIDAVFTQEGQKCILSRGGKSVYSFSVGKGKLGVKVQDQLTSIQRTISHLESEIVAMKQDVNRLTQQSDQISSSIRRKFDQITQTEDLIFQSTKEIRQTKAQIEELAPNEGNLNPQTNQKNIENKISMMQDQLLCAQSRAEALEREIEAIDFQLSESSSSADAEQDLKESRELIVQLLDQKNKVSTDISKTSQEIEALSRSLESFQAQTAQLKDQWEQEADAARQMAPSHMENLPSRAVDQIEAELDAISVQIQLREQDNGDPEEILNEYENKRRELYELTSQLAVNSQIITSLEKALSYRKQRWITFRDCIATRSSLYFDEYLQTRGYTGRLDFDHEAKRLNVSVFTSEAQHAKSIGASSDTINSDTKGLSGGEKSFSTVSLLLALWESVQTPVKCLDEFDVFMDSVNRKLIIGMMLEFARKQGSQYIFISPLGFASFVNVVQDVKVIALSEPVRNQSVISDFV
jgi:chromosome segregation ATPase